jgi:hypothetical protein
MLKMLRMNHRLTRNLQISRPGIRVGSIAASQQLLRSSADHQSPRLPETFLCASTLLRLLHSACQGTRKTGILRCQQVFNCLS